MSAEPENVSLAASLLAAVVPRLRVGVRDSQAAPGGGPAQLHGGTVACLCDAQGTVLHITPNAREILGEACERAAEFGLSLGVLLQPEDPEDVDRVIQQFLRTDRRDSFSTDVLTRAPSGSPRWLDVWCRNLLHDVSVAAFLVEIRDVTLKRVDDKLRALLSAAMQHLPESVMVTDTAGLIRFVNPAFEQLTGYGASEAIGRTPAFLKSGRHRPEFYHKLWRTVSTGGTWHGELCNRRKTGELYFEQVMITPIRDGQGVVSHFLSAARDITEYKNAEAQIEDRAYYDPLTGLATARLLRERSQPILAFARRHGHAAALLRIDLNDLHSINENLGRGVADEVLCSVGQRLQQGLRESDSLARLDGTDEFIVLLGKVADEDATARVVRRLRESVGKPFHIQDHSITVEVTVGVALYPQDATTFEELYACADLARQRACSNGTRAEFFNGQLTELTNDRLSLEEDLGWAWERRQFVLHYQPIVAPQSHAIGAESLTRGHVIGLEALTRWPHLERGMVEPAQFIPLAERTGRIIALDRWAIATALRHAANWSKQGWQGWVSLNLSARSLHDADLAAYLLTCLRQHNVEPGRMVLEITESSAMRDVELTARVLGQLRDAGVLIALDDFGIGHSSLGYLKHFPVDILKLDHRFVHDIGHDSKVEQLIEVIITVAHRMGARIVAEGVEAEDQLEWLRAAGCDYVQGYLIGRPQPGDGWQPAGPLTA